MVNLQAVLARVGEERVRQHIAEWRDSVEPGRMTRMAELVRFRSTVFPGDACPPIEAVTALVFSASVDGVDGVTCTARSCLTGYNTTHKFVRRAVEPHWVGELPAITLSDHG